MEYRRARPLSRETAVRNLALALVLVLPLLAALAAVPPAASASQPGYDWLQFAGGAEHSGDNTQETTLAPGNVGGLRRMFRVDLPGIADNAPVYLSGVATDSGTRDLLFLTTKEGQLLARDAHTGAEVWTWTPPAPPCGASCFTTASPAIDPGRQYVYSYSPDGYVHRFAAGTGAEVTTGGWPELTTRKPGDEKGSSSLSIATARSGISYLYVTHAGFGWDEGDYQGNVTAIDLQDGSQRVFNALCSDQTLHFDAQQDCPDVRAGIWARAGVIYDPDTDRIYFTASNGTFAPDQHRWGDSTIALTPDGSSADGTPLDSYTPADYQQLQDDDLDLGSTAPALLPALPGSRYAHLAVQGGKDEQLRLLNLDNLSGQGGPGNVGGELQVLAVPQGGQILAAPAVWRDPASGDAFIFVATDNGIAGLHLTVDPEGTPVLVPVWAVAGRGTSPLVANGVLYVAGTPGIRALDARNGALLWQDTVPTSIHWESPIVANGVLYLADGAGTLAAYALLPPNPALGPTTVIPNTLDSATITLTTDRTTSARVFYATSPAVSTDPGQPTTADAGTAGDPNLAFAHALTLRGLRPGGTYYYVVRVTDEDGAQTTSPVNGPFTVPTLEILGTGKSADGHFAALVAVPAGATALAWSADGFAHTQPFGGGLPGRAALVAFAGDITAFGPLPAGTYHLQVQITTGSGTVRSSVGDLHYDPGAPQAFADVPFPPQTPDAQAIYALAGRGIVNGYDDGTGRFGPLDPVLRAQAAALDARALGWDGERGIDDFSDQGEIDDGLWNDVRVLADRDVAHGFGDGTFDPTGTVTQGQWISLIARAMVAKGLWQDQPDTGCLPGTPATGQDRQDLVNYCHYLPDLPALVQAGDYTTPAARGLVAVLLWRALAWCEGLSAGMTLGPLP